MKKLLLLILILTGTIITAQTVNIPDSNFEQALIDIGIDTNGLNGNILASDAQNVGSLNVSNRNINSLEGIKAFTTLTALQCQSNNLTSLDLNLNTILSFLNCELNQISNLNLNQNTAITALNCSNNPPLSSLNVKNGTNTSMVNFIADENPNLLCIDVDNVGYSNANWTNIDSQTSFSVNCNSPQTYVPDDNFEQALIDLNLDSGPLDDYVTTANIQFIANLDVSGKNISTLEGIEDFQDLFALDCSNNDLGSLDISQNTNLSTLFCSSNNLTALNVSQNILLDILDCSGNSINNLDVTQNTLLTRLIFTGNQITTINLSQNLALDYVSCGGNQLTGLDVSQNTALRELRCTANQLTSLDVTNNNALTILACNINQLTSLDLNNHSALTELDCNMNQLGMLNVKNGNNSNVTFFNASNNPNLLCIEVDDVSYSNTNWANIDSQTNFSLDCSNQAQTFIPDDNFEQALIDLGYDSGPLDDFVPTANINTLVSLAIQNNNITDLTGIEDFVALQLLDCSNNQLTTLDLSANIALTGVYASNNNLVILNLKTGNTSNFEEIITIDNPNLLCIAVDDPVYATANLSDDIDSQTSYNENCTGPQTYIPDDNFEQALIDLGYDSGTLDDYVSTININNITSLNVSNRNIIDLTGIEDFTALSTLLCSNNQISTIDLSQNINLENFNGSNNSISILDISQNLDLKTLSCFNNQLTSIDVNSNINLETIRLFGNQLSSIDITQNTALLNIQIDSNQLEDIDVSQNTALETLSFENNQITTLDVSQNTALTQLSCNANQLISLDLSLNTALTYLKGYNNPFTSLNVKNGNNTNVTYFDVDNTPNLSCIEVDDVSYSEANWTDIDPQVSFSEDCSVSQTYVPDDNFEQALIDLGYDSGTLDDFVPTANIDTITTLNVSNKNINDLTGIEDFIALTSLSCSSNNLTSIDISLNSNLSQLLISNNQLTNLITTSNFALTNINCNNNQLTSLDVSNNGDLISLSCNENLLIDLELTENGNLTSLSCNENLLTSLDLTENFDLTTFSCFSNQLTSLDIKNGANTNITTFIASSNPNLLCIEVDDTSYSDANWTNIDPQVSFSEDCSTLNLNNFELENSVIIYPNPASSIVNIKTPNNTTIDTIEVVNLAGKRIQTIGSKTRIDVSELASGFYLLKISVGQQKIIKKLLVNKSL